MQYKVLKFNIYLTYLDVLLIIEQEKKRKKPFYFKLRGKTGL